MKWIEASCARLGTVAVTAFFLVSTATALYIPTPLYQYPGTSNNTTRLSIYTLLAQGPEGDILYDRHAQR